MTEIIKKYCPDCRGWVDVSHSKGRCPFCGNDEMEDEENPSQSHSFRGGSRGL